jgi:hypothetical protein
MTCTPSGTHLARAVKASYNWSSDQVQPCVHRAWCAWAAAVAVRNSRSPIRLWWRGRRSRIPQAPGMSWMAWACPPTCGRSAGQRKARCTSAIPCGNLPTPAPPERKNHAMSSDESPGTSRTRWGHLGCRLRLWWEPPRRGVSCVPCGHDGALPTTVFPCGKRWNRPNISRGTLHETLTVSRQPSRSSDAHNPDRRAGYHPHVR